VSIRYKDSPHPIFETCGKQEGCGAGARPFTRSHGRTHRGRSTRRRILGIRGPFSSMGTRMAKVETELERAQVTARHAPQGHGRQLCGCGSIALPAGCRARVRALLDMASQFTPPAPNASRHSSDSRWIGRPESESRCALTRRQIRACSPSRQPLVLSVRSDQDSGQASKAMRSCAHAAAARLP
jgi:hypothetical protein